MSTTPWQLLCPAGTLATVIAVLHGPFVYRVGPVTCSDGKVMPGASSSYLSATSANYTYYTPSSFIAGFPAVYTGGFIGGMKISSSTGQEVLFGTPGNWGGAYTVQPPALCPAGSFLAGVFGKIGPQGVVSIGPFCRAAGESTTMQHATAG